MVAALAMFEGAEATADQLRYVMDAAWRSQNRGNPPSLGQIRAALTRLAAKRKVTRAISPSGLRAWRRA